MWGKAEFLAFNLILRDDAIEQAKIYAMRDGANAITNLICLFGVADWTHNCWKYVECQADAIHVD